MGALSLGSRSAGFLLLAGCQLFVPGVDTSGASPSDASKPDGGHTDGPVGPPTEACASQVEDCTNGIDDNCNGLIDEGCGGTDGGGQ